MSEQTAAQEKKLCTIKRRDGRRVELDPQNLWDFKPTPDFGAKPEIDVRGERSDCSWATSSLGY